MTTYFTIQPWITSFIFVAFNVFRIVGSSFDYMNMEIGVAERLYLDLNLAVIGSHPFLSIAFSLSLIFFDVLLVPGILFKKKIFLLLWLSAYAIVLTLIIAKLFVTCGWFFFLLVTGQFEDSLSFLSSFAIQGIITLINVNSWEFIKYHYKLLEKRESIVPAQEENIVV
ncbi:hypothetical protein ACFFRR_006620 [Megaselia abdita]